MHFKTFVYILFGKQLNYIHNQYQSMQKFVIHFNKKNKASNDKQKVKKATLTFCDHHIPQNNIHISNRQIFIAHKRVVETQKVSRYTYCCE